MKHLYARRLLRLCLRLRLKHQQHHLSPSSISASSSSSISSSAMARKTVKEAVNSFADKTSMHGVPSLVRARNPRAKLFWSLVCVVAMGMFIFMLISLILKYFQYPVIVKVDQIPNAMVRPRLSFCNQRHINTLDITAITHLFMGRSVDQLQIPSPGQRSAVNYFYRLLTSLNHLRTELSKFRTRRFSDSPVTTMSGHIYKLNKSKEQAKRKNESRQIEVVEENRNHLDDEAERNFDPFHTKLFNDSLLRNWSKLTDQLTMRPLITTLLPSEHLQSLASKFEEFIIHCQKMGIRCTMQKDHQWEQWLHSDFFRCFTFDIMKGHGMDEATSQGISNGVTFIFLAGSGMIASNHDDETEVINLHSNDKFRLVQQESHTASHHGNTRHGGHHDNHHIRHSGSRHGASSEDNTENRGSYHSNEDYVDSNQGNESDKLYPGYWTIPGLDNTFEPGAGSDGIRLNVHEPGTMPNPSYEGLDIPLGVSAVIGISSKEINRLPSPYSNCTNENIELYSLMEAIQKDCEDCPEMGHDTVERSHREIDCQSACLQRHIWKQCKCLDITLTLPFFDRRFMCGYSKYTDVLTFPEKYNMQHCLSAENMTSFPECRELLGKLFGDLECLKMVKSWHLTQNNSESYNCKCPPSCHSISYNLDYGNSQWPGNGPELDSAYEKIVKRKIIPYFERQNSSLAEAPLRYFSQWDNRQNIMRNFVRITLYIKDLTVQTTQQVEAYTALDLLSDIGGQLGLWVGISVITLCEIIALFSQLVHYAFNYCRNAGRKDMAAVHQNDLDLRYEEHQALNVDTKV